MTTDGRVLIFGGVGGIGEALARRLTAGGQAVALTSRTTERAAKLASELGPNAKALACDVTDADQIKTAVFEAASDGPLSGLAYCVGSIDLMPLARSKPDHFAKAFALNVIGAAMAIKEAAPSLKASGHGSVVLFSTVAVRQGFQNHAVVATAKGGIEGLTVSLAADLAPDVRVNAIAPSLTDTPLAGSILASETMRKSLSSHHPTKRLGTPEDHAALAAFLLSQEAGWMTGQIIGLDGGRGTLRTGRD